jgi:hypothetical protein
MGAWARRQTVSGPALLFLALPLLGISRLLPAHGFGLWLRLVAATLLLFLPGALVARALRLRGASASVAWTLAALVPALMVVFLVHTTIWVALIALCAIALGALPFAWRVVSGPPAWDTLVVALVGVLFGIALWHVAGVVHGDALFHLGRVRKLDELGSLHVRSVDEFADGGLHPGYAFPLWHGFLALVAKLAGVDPTQVILHEPSAVTPVAFAVAYETGLALFRTVWTGVAFLLATVALGALAPGHGGTFVVLAQPGTLDRQVLVPATLTVFFLTVRNPSARLGLTVAALGGVVFLVHASTAVFLALPLLGFLLVRLVWTRRDLVSAPLAFGAYVAPAALAYVWIAPIVRETVTHSPTASTTRHAIARYADELTVHSIHRYALRPEVFGRGGAIAIAALVAVPLAAFASRRHWAALVVGGSLVVFVIELVPWIFPRFADAVSLSQARRAAGFVPYAFALTGGAAVIACFARFLVLPIALAAGIALQIAYPGGFGTLAGSGPSVVTWIAAGGAVAALVAGFFLAGDRDARGPLVMLALALFVTPVAVHGFRKWTPTETQDANALTPGLLAALRHDVPKRAIVFSDLETSYRISAYAPVYVASAPPAHVANTRANFPYGRRLSTIRYFLTGDIRIPERYHATWLVIDKSRFHLSVPWRLVYGDSRFALYHRSG